MAALEPVRGRRRPGHARRRGCGPAPAGEVGHIDGRWYGVPTGTLVQDLDGWHVPTFDDPLSAAAELGARLGVTVPPFPET